MNARIPARRGSGTGGPPHNARRLLAAATAASLVLYFVPGAELATYPIRLFTTIIHEGGHALMTLLTGGAVVGIGISPGASGLTQSLGGVPWLILMAGYLGATTFGAVTLHLGRRARYGRRGLGLMAAVVLGITALWIHPLGIAGGNFGFLAGLVVGGLLLLGARFLPEQVAQFVTSFLAVQLCLNAIYDLRTLLLLTTYTSADNDAKFMAQAYGLTPWFWAGLWAIMAVLILGASLRAYWRER